LHAPKELCRLYITLLHVGAAWKIRCIKLCGGGGDDVAVSTIT